MAHKFQFLRETKIRKERYDFSRWHSCHLRSKLPKGIYWTQTTDGGCILWNWDLLQDYLLFGDRAEHQVLIEEFLATLPGGKKEGV
jgi:hypothetical protein